MHTASHHTAAIDPLLALGIGDDIGERSVMNAERRDFSLAFGAIQSAGFESIGHDQIISEINS